MKKLLTISILFVVMLAMSTTLVNATTNAELPDAIMAIARKYGATDADKMKIERYIADNPVSEAEANAIVAKVQEAAAIMDEAGVTDPKQLTAEQKDRVKAKFNEAASVVGVTLSFTGEVPTAYKNGKALDLLPAAAPASNGTASAPAGSAASSTKLVYTGSNSYIALAIGGTVIALATIIIARKKVVNA